MKAARPWSNPFASLRESDDEDGASFDPSPATPSAPAPPAKGESASAGVPIVDLLVSKLDTDTPSIADLSRALEDIFAVRKKQSGQWRLDYENYDGLDPAQYDEKIQVRLQTFSKLEDESLLEYLDEKLRGLESAIHDEFQDLVATVSGSLAATKKPTGYGLLFLLGRALRLFPPLYRKLNLEIEQLAERGPVVAWLIAYLVKDKPEAVAIVDLIRLYHHVMVNADVSCAAVSVALSHVMRDVVREHTKLPSSYYAAVLHLSLCKGNHRSDHVREVIQTLRGKVSISDLGNFPKVLMTRYQRNPRCIAPLMVRCCLKIPKFIDAWVRTHRELPEISRQVLQLVADKLPAEMLEKFPIDELRDPITENQQLALQNKQLVGASSRLLVLIAIATACFVLTTWLT
jgi:hypothetical protein